MQCSIQDFNKLYFYLIKATCMTLCCSCTDNYLNLSNIWLQVCLIQVNPEGCFGHTHVINHCFHSKLNNIWRIKKVPVRSMSKLKMLSFEIEWLNKKKNGNIRIFYSIHMLLSWSSSWQFYFTNIYECNLLQFLVSILF